MKTTLSIFMIFISLLLAGTAAFAQTNYKIRQEMTMSGQKMETTVYVRGVRKRTEGGGMMGFGNDVATIEQCDLKQTVKVNNKKRLYIVDPFDTGERPTPDTSRERPADQPVRQGGTVTYVTNLTDTGERKTMFGMTARHIKTSMSVEASPDACMKSDMKIETDGWYIDLPEFSCPMTYRPPVPPASSRGGCQDKISYRTSGGAKVGFPLQETRTISNGGMTFTQSVDTLEFSKAALDAALFEIPQGYAKATNDSELFGTPDVSAMIRQAQQNANENERERSRNDPSVTANMPDVSAPTAGAKRPGVIRIGVLTPTNKGDSVSLASLQGFLVERLTSGNTEAIRVGSEADARAAGCDYLLSSEISKLKQSTGGKIGGVFGKVTSLPTGGASNYDAQADFKLVSMKTGQSVLQSKATSKSESDAQRAAEAILAQEAAAVLGAAK